MSSPQELEIVVLEGPVTTAAVDALVIAYRKGAEASAPWDELDEASGGLIAEALRSPAFQGKPGSCLAVPTRGALPFADLLLAGLGEAESVDLDRWRRAVAAAANTARGRGAKRLGVAIPDGEDLGDAETLAAVAAEAIVLGAYRFTEFKDPAPDEAPLEQATLLAPESTAEAVRAATIGARAACWARDLINTSPSDKRPPQLAERAAAMAAEVGLDCEIIDAARARELGMGALLAVARGSSVEPRMVILEHAPADLAAAPPVVLVGKGVTFDTGGISIKPAASMDEMKADMSGAAAVLATMRAVAELQLPLRVVALVPMAENMPGGDAYRPGDLIRAFNGTTIEVLNTDAEGRLILADALAYGRERFDPVCMVDLATLTGACVVALGEDVAGVMDNNAELAAELQRAGEAAAEPVWRLPMFPKYRELIKSRFADIKNTGGRWGGAISAAKFLEEFVGDTPWAHLDIAGPAYSSKAAPYRAAGGRGFGVRLLLAWLNERSVR